MLLSVIMPVYNEANTILKIIARVKNADTKSIEKEIIIVDDCSIDGTREILKSLNGVLGIRVFFHERNYGKGRAIRTALEHVRGDFIIVQDADLEYNPDDYYKLIEPILNGDARVVYGSRNRRNNPRGGLSFYLGGVFLSFIANFLYETKITDEATCYKVFKKEVLDGIKLECERFEFCPEITAKVARKKIKIYEIPIGYNPRGKKKGKKIGWKDGLQAIWILFKYRFFD